MKRKGIGSVGMTVLVGLALIGGAGLLSQAGVLNLDAFNVGQTGVGPSPTDACGFATSVSANSDNCGAGSSVDVATFDQAADTRTQVATTVYANQFEKQSDGSTTVADLGSATATGTSRASFTNYNVGNRYEGVAFNGTYDYGTMFSGVVDSSGGETIDAEVLKGDASPGLIARDDASDFHSLTLGSGQDETFDLLRFKANESNRGYNLGLVCYSANNDTVVDDVSFNDNRLTEVSEPDRLNEDQCWRFEDRVGLNGDLDNIPQDFEDIDLEGVTIEIADGQNPNGATTVTFRVADYAPFINSDNPVEDRFDIDVEDEDDADVGNSDQTTTITLN